VALWTRRRFGPEAALLALALYAFDPNLTAHGRYVTTDLLATAPVFATVILWIEYLLTRRRAWLIAAGLSLGVAFTAKLSTLFLAGVLPLLFWIVRPESGGRRALRPFAAACLILFLLAGGVVAAVYAPELLHPDPYSRLRDHLTGTGAAGAALLWLAEQIPAPPFSWLIGIDRLSEINALGRPQYLLGQFSEHGWWYYFPVAVKTPVGTLAALALAAGLAVRLREALRPHGPILLALAAPAAAYFVLSLGSGLNIGHRHLLPVYPFLYVLLGAVLAAASRVRPRLAWAGALLVLAAAAESLSVYPHYLAFCNRAAGGPAAGPRYLLDSNLDWGQAFRHVGRYAREHGIRHVCLFSFGNGAPHRYVPGPSQLDPDNLAAMDCVAAVSATPLYGLYVGPERLRALRERQPLAVVGHSVYLYDLRRNPASAPPER
jgi:4-amino-4-deoxy-L-arabinose transferase-like glycosyltransferase